MQIIKKGYSFDDLLMEPKLSGQSINDAKLETLFSKNITLKIPVVSANMDTVTEHKMAKFMAASGGIGIIHRWMPIEEQAEEVRKVKRAENIVIADPWHISPDLTVNDAFELMEKHYISGLPVVDMHRKVIGIITRRDILFCANRENAVKNVMSKKVVMADKSVSPQEAKNILFKNKIEKLPLVDDKKTLLGLITLKDILREENLSSAAKDRKGRLLAGAAIGVREIDALPRAKALANAGGDAIVVDIAHGHHTFELQMIKTLKGKYAGIDIIGGNIATPQGTRDLIEAGADAVKVGIGPGSSCKTRIVTGVGVPQLSAIFQCAEVAREYSIPVIADGGIKNSGDMAKALAGGAFSVMIGGLLAGTDEAPGERIIKNGQAYKNYRGEASREAKEDKMKKDGYQADIVIAEEGETGLVNYTGSAKIILDQLMGWLKQSMNYLGASDIASLHDQIIWWEISQEGKRESNPHDIKF